MLIPALPGYDFENDSDFTSVEQIASELNDWLSTRGYRNLYAVYGCSMGGSVALMVTLEQRIKIEQLFLLVHWISGNYPDRLYKALMNSSTVLTVWDNEKLVGLTRVLDDTEMLAQIHYVLVHPNYQGNGIAGKMVEYIKKKYKNYLYIEAMPEEKSNVPFYTKHGFSVMENGAAIQICNYGNLNEN